MLATIHMNIESLSLHPAAFGLDISDRSFKIVHLAKRKEGFEIVCFGEFSLPERTVEKGEILQPAGLAKHIKKAVEGFGKKLSTRNVVASLPEEQAFLQVVQLPRMPKEAVEHAARFEAENYIPFPIEKVYLGIQSVEPLVNHLDHNDVLLAALPRTTVDAYVKVLEDAGLTPSVLEIESLAVARALVLKETAATPVLLIDFGATRTSFIIYSGHSVRFTTSISVSSLELTAAIASSLQLSAKEAEDLKIKYGLERQDEERGKKVYEAMIPLLSSLTEQVKRHISFFESHSPHQHLGNNKLTEIRRVILSGGGANLRGFTKFLSQELNKEVMLGNPWVNILETSLKELPPLPFGESLKYATALGLALRGHQPYD